MSSELGNDVVRIGAGMSGRSAGRDDYDEKRKDYEEKSKIDRKDYQIFLGYYRNNDYIVTGKRFTRLCQRGFAKHESYIYLYKRN